jgi:hypothetical protein
MIFVYFIEYMMTYHLLQHRFLLGFLMLVLGLTACQKEPKDIVGIEWVSTSVTLENGQSSYPEHTYLLSFDNAKSFRLSLDVNSCGGSVSFNRRQVSFDDGMNCTEACCDSPYAQRLAENLTKTTEWKRSSSQQLVFYNKKGVELVFTRR